MALLLVAALALIGLVVGASAEGAAWSAAVLVGEPTWTIATLFAMHLLLERGRRAWAWAVAAGSTLGLLAMRLAPTPEVPTTAPPAWSQRVGRCAAALEPPVDPVRLLQWTSPPDAEAALAALAAFEPDVAVFFGAGDPAVEAALKERGGETRRVGEALVHVRGVLHLCGEDAAWEEDGAGVVFVGIPEDTVFPLVVGRLPSVEAGAGWARRRAAATARLTAIAGAARAMGAVLVADAGAPSTFRRLDGAVAAAGLARVVVPPSWPASVLGVPVLPLHPYDRIWAGPAWRVDGSVALTRAGPTRLGGERAAIVTTLVPGAIGGE